MPVSLEQGARFGYLGTAYSALKKAGTGPGTTVLVDGISGTLGIGARLNALAMGAAKIFGTGRNVCAGEAGTISCRRRPGRAYDDAEVADRRGPGLLVGSGV